MEIILDVIMEICYPILDEQIIETETDILRRRIKRFLLFCVFLGILVFGSWLLFKLY